MNKLTKLALDRTLELNQRLANTAANSTAWLFKRDTLIKSGRTWFELVHDGDLMAVRYYGDEKGRAFAEGYRGDKPNVAVFRLVPLNIASFVSED